MAEEQEDTSGLLLELSRILSEKAEKLAKKGRPASALESHHKATYEEGQW